MMDGSTLFPDGFHPVLDFASPDLAEPSAWHYLRYTLPHPVKYYFTDFGISVHIPHEQQPKFVTGTHGIDRSPPELSATLPYDPFKLDIFILGNFFRKTIYEVCVAFTLEMLYSTLCM